MIIETVGIGVGVLIVGGATLAGLYKIVPADYADVVIQNKRIRVFSSYKAYNASSGGKSAYFKIPSWVFINNLGMQVHRIPLKIIPIDVPNFLAFDKDRARFVCDIVAYITVKDPVIAAQRFSGNMLDLKAQISVVIQSTMRDATTKKTVREIINDREAIIDQISPQLVHTLDNWGLDLKSIELIDFKDPKEPEREGEEPPHVIADISSMIETQINSEARQRNADQKKLARTKEAEADQAARIIEVTRDETVSKREQERDMNVATQQKLATVQKLEVTRTQTVVSQEIEKQRQIVLANQNKEVEAIVKEQQKLKGEGNQAFAEATAKGTAAITRETGLAEAAALKAKQEALAKYDDETIKALVAKDVVEVQRQVGLESAKALAQADLRIFIGSDNGNFDMGKAVEAINVSSGNTAQSVLNRLARPLDLGGTSFDEIMKTAEPRKPKKA